MAKTFKSLFYLFLPIVIGGICGFLIRNSIDYSYLVKPPLAPPNVLFPIAWTIIYLLMGLSYYIYKKEFKNKSIVDVIYYLQLIVNFLWSIIFFLFKARFLSVIWIVLLDILVVILLYYFLNQKKISFYLNIPYMIWILFATYLTIGIYILN